MNTKRPKRTTKWKAVRKSSAPARPSVAVVYIRVSSDEQVKGMSLDFQRDDCLSYAGQKGLEIAQTFEERGESAKFTDRPQLMALLDFCRRNRGKINTLLVWKLDRLSRNQMDYYSLKRTLLDLGITIQSATEQSMEDSNSIAGRIFETFSALQAEIDNTIRSERSRRGMSAKLAAGISPWRPPPGYLCGQSKKRGEKKVEPDRIDPVMFPIIQSALRSYSKGNCSQSELRLKLVELGYNEASKRKPISKQLVWKMLTDYLDFYAGRLTNPWTGERFQGIHQRMLTDAEYRNIISIRDGKSSRSQPKYMRQHPMFPLRGSARCPSCTSLYTAGASRGRNTYYPYYHCKNAGCKMYGKSIRKAQLEQAFSEWMQIYRLTPEFLQELEGALQREVANASTRAGEQRASCLTSLTALKEKRERLYEMREDGSYTREEFLERKETVESDISAIETKLAQSGDPMEELLKCYHFAERMLEKLTLPWYEWPKSLSHRFQKFILPRGFEYHPKSGFGIAIMCCVFELNASFRDGQSLMVPLAGPSLNRLLQEFEELAQMEKEEEHDDFGAKIYDFFDWGEAA